MAKEWTGVHLCEKCEWTNRDDDPVRPAVETQIRLWGDGDRPLFWLVCEKHINDGRETDRTHSDYRPQDRHYYLPIVQPVVDSEQAIAMEVALHAACRLLRICKGDDEAEATLAVLRQAQAEAWDRVHGRAA